MIDGALRPAEGPGPGPERGGDVELDACPLDVLSEGIRQLLAMRSAVERVLCRFVAAYERREGFRADGESSMACWLAAAGALTHAHAGEFVRRARALEELPAVAAAYEEGELSGDQVAAIAQVATPETDSAWVEDAQRLSVPQLQAAARRGRPVPEGDAAAAHKARELTWWADEEHHCVHLRGRLPAAEGTVVVSALEATAARYGPDPVTGVYERHAGLVADALVELVAAGSGVRRSEGARPTVVVHVDAPVLVGDDGAAEVIGAADVAVSPETARRLACDAYLECSWDGPDGRPLGVGRRSRTVPAWMARQVRHRDRCCRFPGCRSTRGTEIHHVLPRGCGGVTELFNLAELCARHHHLVHEGGYSIRGSPEGRLTFHRPDGRPVAQGPPRLHPRLLRRVHTNGLPGLPARP